MTPPPFGSVHPARRTVHFAPSRGAPPMRAQEFVRVAAVHFEVRGAYSSIGPYGSIPDDVIFRLHNGIMMVVERVSVLSPPSALVDFSRPVRSVRSIVLGPFPSPRLHLVFEHFPTLGAPMT